MQFVPTALFLLVASHAASPIVKAGKMIWKLMTKANCTRDSRTGSSSMTRLLIGSRGCRRRRRML